MYKYFLWKGICGSPKNLDVGGPPYLIPKPQKDKVGYSFKSFYYILIFFFRKTLKCCIYNIFVIFVKVYQFEKLANIAGNKDAFFIGAGAGPCHVVGVNSEVFFFFGICLFYYLILYLGWVIIVLPLPQTGGGGGVLNLFHYLSWLEF